MATVGGGYNNEVTGQTGTIAGGESNTVGGSYGSIGGGLAMVAFGAILLANTRFDMSLAWVEDWWPAAIILFGAYLVFKAMQEKAQESGDSEY